MTRADLLEQLAAKTAEMRQAQTSYFAASRSNSFRGDELSTSKRLEREVDKRIAWNEARTTDLAETVAPGRNKVEAGVRVVKLRRTTAVVTGEGFDPEALPPSWRRHVPEKVTPARDEIDRKAAGADLLLGYREGPPPCDGWYEIEGAPERGVPSERWELELIDGEWRRVDGWCGENPEGQGLDTFGMSIEPEPGLDVLRWKPSPPGVTLERRTHVTVE
jgi:hypothetical protein